MSEDTGRQQRVEDFAKAVVGGARKTRRSQHAASQRECALLQAELVRCLIAGTPLTSRHWEHLEGCEYDCLWWARGLAHEEELLRPTRIVYIDPRRTQSGYDSEFFYRLGVTFGPNLTRFMQGAMGTALEEGDFLFGFHSMGEKVRDEEVSVRRLAVYDSWVETLAAPEGIGWVDAKRHARHLCEELDDVGWRMVAEESGDHGPIEREPVTAWQLVDE